MEFTKTICREVFEGKLKLHSSTKSEPQSAVAFGLARTGPRLQRCRTFVTEVENTFTVDALKKILAPEAPNAFKRLLLASSEVLYDRIMKLCIDKWKEGATNAADGLAKAFLEEGRKWEASDAGCQLKKETAQQLIKAVRITLRGMPPRSSPNTIFSHKNCTSQSTWEALPTSMISRAFDQKIGPAP
jgi:hypothetical protein